MNRRQFIGGFGGLVAVSALPGCRTGKNDTFGERGGFERLNLAYSHVEAGATAPFSILHVSDTHFTAAYEHEPVYVCGKAPARTKTFGGRQIESFESTLAWAGKNVDYVLHTGDLIDFQSEANFDLVKKYYGETVFGAMGNHEFYSYLPDEQHTWQEPFKDRSWPLLKATFPDDPRFFARVVNGVNFICLDDVFGTVQPDQVELFHAEAKKGLPMVLCMHVPFFTDKIWRITRRFWGNGNKKFRSAEVPDPSGDCKRQQDDPTTRDFIAYLKSEKLLKALLVGHEHVAMEDRFSPTAMEYVTGGNFLFHAREVLFS